MTILKEVSKKIGKRIKKEDIIIYESTVYPGATEEILIPILEEESGMEYNKDFYCGYSPERINPGDKKNRIENILKVTSGSTKKTSKVINKLYKSVIKAGTYLAPTIKIAEASKIIENVQRDVNIALMNEISKICDKLEIDTNEVIKAASTKWNFLKFKPGIVGGHCISVDPYYLIHKAEEIGYNPEIMIASRKVNNSMGKYIANQIIKLIIKEDKKVKKNKILILGFSFKENCPDTRNTKVIDIINELREFECEVTISDYWVDKIKVEEEYNIEIKEEVNYEDYETIVIAVAHEKYKNLKIKNQTIYDLKSILK
jgi:UDP-N-acetyl-D-galactosamine dehydrogenase